MTDGYNATYGAGEIAEVIIDVLIGLLAEWYTYVALIALVFIYIWYRRKTKGGLI